MWVVTETSADTKFWVMIKGNFISAEFNFVFKIYLMIDMKKSL